jgi:hypothetical protein
MRMRFPRLAAVHVPIVSGARADRHACAHPGRSNLSFGGLSQGPFRQEE